MSEAHPFWRIFITGSSETGWEAYLRVVQLFESKSLGADALAGGVAWHNTELEPGVRGVNPGLAFDGQHDTSYRTAMNPGRNGDWLAYGHGQPVSIVAVRIVQFGNTGNHITSFELEWSDNGEEWHTVASASNLPTDVYDSRVHGFGLVQNRPIRRSVKYTPPPPPKEHTRIHFRSAGISLQQMDTYTANIHCSSRVRVWMGERVAIVVCEEQTEFRPQSPSAMALIIHNLEAMLSLFDEVIGRVPVNHNPLYGRVRYEVANLPGAAGLASHGVAGVATGPAFIAEMYNMAVVGRSLVNHVFFYETMRNYIFPEHFTQALDFHLPEGEDCWGWVNQGFINVVGSLFCEHMPGVEFTYHGQTRAEFISRMEAHVLHYMREAHCTWENTWLVQMIPWSPHQSVDNLFSGLVVHLYRNYGGVRFLKRFFRVLPILASECAPTSKADRTRARDNLFVASSVAADCSLEQLFREQLRWDISRRAVESVDSLLTVYAAICEQSE